MTGGGTGGTGGLTFVGSVLKVMWICYCFNDWRGYRGDGRTDIRRERFKGNVDMLLF